MRKAVASSRKGTTSAAADAARKKKRIALISCKARNQTIFWPLRELKESNGSSVD